MSSAVHTSLHLQTTKDVNRCYYGKKLGDAWLVMGRRRELRSLQPKDELSIRLQIGS